MNARTSSPALAPADEEDMARSSYAPRELPEEGMKPRSISGTARYLFVRTDDC